MLAPNGYRGGFLYRDFGMAASYVGTAMILHPIFQDQLVVSDFRISARQVTFRGLVPSVSTLQRNNNDPYVILR